MITKPKEMVLIRTTHKDIKSHLIVFLLFWDQWQPKHARTFQQDLSQYPTASSLTECSFEVTFYLTLFLQLAPQASSLKLFYLGFLHKSEKLVWTCLLCCTTNHELLSLQHQEMLSLENKALSVSNSKMVQRSFKLMSLIQVGAPLPTFSKMVRINWQMLIITTLTLLFKTNQQNFYIWSVGVLLFSISS